MRTMIFIASVGLAVTAIGCNDDNHRLDALESSNAVLTRMRADITTLKAQVAGLPAPVDTKPLADRLDALEAAVIALPAPVDTKPLTDRLDALEAKAASTVKVPHLVLDKTGEDLGQLVSYPDVVWSPKVKAEVSLTSSAPLLYDQENCVGNAVVRGVHLKSFVNTGTQNLFKVTGAPVMANWQSFLNANGQCQGSIGSGSALPVADTGMANIIYPQDQLRLDLL